MTDYRTLADACRRAADVYPRDRDPLLSAAAHFDALAGVRSAIADELEAESKRWPKGYAMLSRAAAVIRAGEVERERLTRKRDARQIDCEHAWASERKKIARIEELEAQLATAREEAIREAAEAVTRADAEWRRSMQPGYGVGERGRFIVDRVLALKGASHDE